MSLRYGMPSTLTAIDAQGLSVQSTGPFPEVARTRPLTQQDLLSRLQKTERITPYYLSDLQLELEPGLTLSASAINTLRRDVLSRLSALRGQVPQTREGSFTAPTVYASHRGKPVYTVSIQSVRQLTPELLGFQPALLLYMPLHLVVSGHPSVTSSAPDGTRVRGAPSGNF